MAMDSVAVRVVDSVVFQGQTWSSALESSNRKGTEKQGELNVA